MKEMIQNLTCYANRMEHRVTNTKWNIAIIDSNRLCKLSYICTKRLEVYYMRTWFAVENSLVDRNDLTAYEKLCGMVLARYAGRSEFDHLLTTDIIAVKMGVSSEAALEALRGLVRKGLVDADSTSDLFVEGSENHIKDIELEEFKDEKDTHVIKSELRKSEAQPVHFENLEFESEFEPEIDEDDEGFDNLDKLLQESKISEIAHAVEAVDQVPVSSNKGYESYQSIGNAEVTALKPETAKEDIIEGPVAEEIDPEILEKSIHEQSDSVRAWIEESEAVAQPIIRKTATSNREALVTQVIDMIEEPINDRQARIILGLAEYDLDKVKKCYLAAQNTQVSDKIDMLIHELQKKEEPEEPKRVPRTSQVDHIRLNQMKKYQAMKNKK